MNFNHIVGKSTFKCGFTIPKSMYHLLDLPQKGNRRKIQLVYDDVKTHAWLYRLKNQYGHVQIRYDNKFGENFRRWLKTVFNYSYIFERNINEYFKVEIINQELFKIIQYPINDSESNLIISEILTHKIEENALFIDCRFTELLESIRNVSFINNQRQMYYNSMIKEQLTNLSWDTEQKVVEDKNIRLKCDFRKKDFQLEVEFGNARTYYQDIIKFVMSYNSKLINIGGLLVPSKSFAKHLCHLGHLNAIKKSEGAKSRYTGMMNFKKAITEFNFIKGIFDIPFFIIGINSNNLD